jgi:DNA-binding transcriptional regulator YdaS (Cro superfamily)
MFCSMNILDYLKSLPKPDRHVFAAQCGTTLGHLQNAAYGYKPFSAELAIRIEAASDGAVRAEGMRPDVPWHVIRGDQAKQAA